MKAILRVVAGLSVLVSSLTLLTVSGGSAGGPDSAAAATRAPKPAIGAFTASPTGIDSAGGPLTLSGSVSNASTCTISVTPVLAGLPQTVPCSSFSASINLPANATSKVVRYKFTLTAQGASGTKTKHLTVKEAATPPPSISSFTATPGSLTGAGGQVVLATSVTNATSCAFSANQTLPGLPVTLGCSSGTAQTTVTLPASTSKKTKTYTFHLAATGSKTVKASALKVAVGPKTTSPTLSSLTPTAGAEAGGTMVTLTGTSLTGASAVAFGSTPATRITVVSDTSVTAVSPGTTAAGAVDVTVTTPGGTSNPEAFTYVANPALPTVTGVSPTSGPQGGGTSVIIIGTSLAGAKSVAFGTSPGTITADSDTSITVTSPVGTPGPVDTLVTTGAGTSSPSTADQFTYLASYTPCSSTLTQSSVILPGTYMVDCILDVPAGVTLTIDPGTVLKFSGGSVTVEGTLDAVGTAQNPITFTSFNDNTVGGTTGSGSPARGDWSGIAVQGTSASADIEHADIEYTGTGVQANGSSFVLQNSTLMDTGDGVTGNSTAASVVNDTFTGTLNPVLLSADAVTVEGNTATGVSGTAYAVGSSSLDLSKLSGNSASGSGDLVMQLAGGLGTSGTWMANDLPLAISSVNNAYFGLTVPAGITLTIDPGVVVKADGSTCTIDNGNSLHSLCVAGTLDAVGTAQNPITFTSFNDNTVGGTTGSGSPARGDWSGIAVQGTSASGTFEYIDGNYAGTFLSASTKGILTVEYDKFQGNGTSLSLNASYDLFTLSGSNFAIHYNWFDGNVTSITATSTWSPVNPACEYLPLISADGNKFGPQMGLKPMVSADELISLQAEALVTQTYPDGWVDNLVAGTSDLIGGSLTFPCSTPPVGDPSCAILALPLNFDTGIVLPTSCDVKSS